MTLRSRGPLESAAAMRQRFDAGFAAPAVERIADQASFVALRIQGDGFALRIRDMSGLVAARKIVPIPTPAAGLLGLASIRGVVVAVFSLGGLMGYGDPPARWFVLCPGEGDDTIALGFSDFEGYIEVSTTDVRPVDSGQPRGTFVRELVRAPGGLRGIIDVMSLVKSAYQPAALARPMKE